MSELVSELRQTIRDIPDFPKPGIVFKDIAPVLASPELFARVIDAMAQRVRAQHPQATHIAGIESRGFIFGAPLARALSLPFVLVRKPGKLPGEVVARSYELEYGSDALEVQKGAFGPGDHVVVVDDLLATGGTCEAAVGLIASCGARVVEALFLIELSFLQGSERLGSTPVHALVSYEPIT